VRNQIVHVEVLNVGNDWFTFRVPGWDHTFTMGRFLVPREVDEALDDWVATLTVAVNVGAKHWSHIRFSYWGVSVAEIHGGIVGSGRLAERVADVGERPVPVLQRVSDPDAA
jgi:hypothetical protein